MKIVINKDFGGFSISIEAAQMMASLGNEQAKAELEQWQQENIYIKYFLRTGQWPNDCPQDKISSLKAEATYYRKARFYGYGYVKNFSGGYNRTSPELITAVETLHEKANGKLANLVVIEIPDGTDYEIEDYDGIESIHEKHKIWR